MYSASKLSNLLNFMFKSLNYSTVPFLRYASSTGKLPPMLSKGINYICLCGTDIPESGPQLKNMKADNSSMTLHAA